MVTIFRSVKATQHPYYREISVILERIKTGVSKQQIDLVRSITDADERNVQKLLLPAICFSGRFKERADDAIIEHSGYICLDFDHFPDKETFKANRDYLISDAYTFALFTSPSGDGLKVIVKIPPEIKYHRAYFRSLQKYYDNEYFDVKCINESRVCYESYDPELYHNPGSETFTKRSDFVEHQKSISTPILPLRSENRIIEKIRKEFEETKSLSKGNRNTNLYWLARTLNEYGISENDARSVIFSYQNCGLDDKEMKTLLRSAYSNRAEHNTKYFEDDELKDFIKSEVQSGTPLKQIYSQVPTHKPEEIDLAINNMNKVAHISEFWEFDKHGKCHISHGKFKAFLEQNGFCKYYPEGSENYIFIRIENAFVENTSPALIKDFVLEYLEKQPTRSPYELMAGSPKYFKDDYLSLLKVQDIIIEEDGEDYAMIYYMNTAVKVKKDSVEAIDYLNLNGLVWRKHVIDRDYIHTTENGGIFEKFFILASGEEGNRVLSMKTTVGYLLHSFKTLSNNRAVIFNDEVISENPNGGSGKGIICNAVGKIKRVALIDGKQFDFQKSFAYQTVSADTQVLVFDDVKNRFPFENLFSLITEGITLEKKNKDAIKIPVRKSPKIVITTNYTIGGSGGSFARRKHEVELSSYFSNERTPADEFGLQLFDDFSKNEWMLFDNFMIGCIQSYLKHGLLSQTSINLETRKFITNTNHDFFEYTEEGNIHLNDRIYRRAKFTEFIESYPDNKKFLTEKRFAGWLESYAAYMKGHYSTGRDTIGGRWSYIQTSGSPAPQTEENQQSMPF